MSFLRLEVFIEAGRLKGCFPLSATELGRIVLILLVQVSNGGNPRRSVPTTLSEDNQDEGVMFTCLPYSKPGKRRHLASIYEQFPLRPRRSGGGTSAKPRNT